MANEITYYTLQQYCELVTAIVQALPKALKGVPYEKVLEVSQYREKLDQALNQSFLSVLGQMQEQPTFSRDMREEGWELIEDVVGSQKVPASKLELVVFVGEWEEYVLGGDMLQRAQEFQATLGQRQAEYLLEHQEAIPEAWRQYNLVFPGTIWRARSGDRQSPYLRWESGHWELHFYWFAYDFHPADRLVRSCE